MTDNQGSAFADKLVQLFRVIRAADGREFSPEHVAAWVRANTEVTISASYLYMLRRGERENPTKDHIEALAAFFGIPPSYFFNESLGARMSEELELLAALRDSDVRFVAVRTAELHDDARRSVAAMLREMSWARRPPASGDDELSQRSADAEEPSTPDDPGLGRTAE